MTSRLTLLLFLAVLASIPGPSVAQQQAQVQQLALLGPSQPVPAGNVALQPVVGSGGASNRAPYQSNVETYMVTRQRGGRRAKSAPAAAAAAPAPSAAAAASSPVSRSSRKLLQNTHQENTLRLASGPHGSHIPGDWLGVR